VNGLGEELLLGEAVMARPTRLLAAWPLPYRGGEIHISFATAGGLGGGLGKAEVALYDVRGRRVRTMVRGLYPAGLQGTVWDGNDDTGRPVASGAYFLRSRSLGHDELLKVVVTR
jgi:hypothetical protein